jgi:flagellar FliL protein
MADEGEVNTEEKSGGLKKIIILAVVGLVLIGGSVGGTLFFLGAFDEKPALEQGEDGENTEGSAEAGEGEGGEEAEAPKAAAIYVPLKPAIVVNYNSRGRQRFVEAKITLMVRSEEVLSAVELHMPMIRNNMVMVLSGQIYEDLQTPEGKEQLRQQLLKDTQSIIAAEIGEPGGEQVLFTNFVMQ